jgi:recombination protein RecA
MTADRGKALTAALSQIERAFGKNAIMKMGERKAEAVPVISSGSLSLDLALGIGGYPKGRIVEIYGPESSGKSTLALHAVAEAQKAGGTALYIDAEHALDPKYARALGVDVDAMLLSQPDGGEQALEIADKMVASGAVDIVVIDSVAALVPRAELEGEMGDSHVGLHARLMSQALRKLTGTVARTGALVIFINQIRHKIGVMFGCFHYSSRVTLADGTSEKIGKIVNQRLPVEVLSFDAKTGRIVPSKVVSWFDNGNAERFLKIEVSGGPSGRRQMGVTENHTIFTPDGEVSAGDLRIGDAVLAQDHDFVFSGGARQMLIGSVLGDASVRLSRAGGSGMVRFGHGAAQQEYALWKRSMLGGAAGAARWNKAGSVFFDTLTHAGAAALFSQVRLPGVAARRKIAHRTLSSELAAEIGPQALAIWYLDDGSYAPPSNGRNGGVGKSVIYTKSMDAAGRENAMSAFERLGIGRPAAFANEFRFSAEQTLRLHEVIAPFVHPSMDYKLNPRFRGRFAWQADASEVVAGRTVVVETVLSVSEKPRTRSMRKFDLEVAGTHTYLVDGVVVHNSPETTTGGNALKFYASIRLDVRRIETLKDKDEAVGNKVRVKVVKNKMAPPFREAVFEIAFGKGVSRASEILEMGVAAGIIEKSGSWYSYDSQRIGQGAVQAKAFLDANPETARAIVDRIRSAGATVEG